MDYEFSLAPKDMDSQSAAYKNKITKDDLKDYIVQPKYDGCMAIVIPHEGRIISRTGELVQSMPFVLEEAKRLFQDKVLFGEAWKFDTPFPEIGGKFRRHSPSPDLFLVVFDAVPYDDWIQGACPTPYETRLAELSTVCAANPTAAFISASRSPLGCIDVQAFANNLVAVGGYDGAMLRDPNAPWHTGASKNGEAIKVKPVKSLDLKCVGWFVGKGKYANSAGGITVEYQGTRTDVGTGFSDAERREIAKGVFATPIVEIEFMGLTRDGKLREPRFKSWRYDKTEPD